MTAALAVMMDEGPYALSDEAVLRAARRLFDQTVEHFCRRNFDPTDAEDAVGAAIEVLFKQLNQQRVSFSSVGAVANWLKTTALREALQELRSPWVQRRQSLGETASGNQDEALERALASSEVSARVLNPEEQFFGRELAALVEALPLPDQEILLHVSTDQRDAAASPAVRKRRSRIRNRLRKALTVAGYC